MNKSKTANLPRHRYAISSIRPFAIAAVPTQEMASVSVTIEN